jgi:hypothetical protein
MAVESASNRDGIKAAMAMVAKRRERGGSVGV